MSFRNVKENVQQEIRRREMIKKLINELRCALDTKTILNEDEIRKSTEGLEMTMNQLHVLQQQSKDFTATMKQYKSIFLWNSGESGSDLNHIPFDEQLNRFLIENIRRKILTETFECYSNTPPYLYTGMNCEPESHCRSTQSDKTMYVLPVRNREILVKIRNIIFERRRQRNARLRNELSSIRNKYLWRPW